MIDLSEEVEKFILPRKQPRPLEVEFAGETYGCDPDISELEVPHVAVYIPFEFIRKYNLATRGKDSRKLPDALTLWNFLHPHLVGKGLVAEDQCGSEGPVDEIIKELLEWPYYARYEKPMTNDNGILLEVKADYDPYWEDKEEA